MASPLVVNALELLRRPGSRKDLVVVVPLDDVDLAGEDRLVADSEVSGEQSCESTRAAGGVLGAVRGGPRGVCRRCLRDVEGELTIGIHETYQETRTDPDAFPIENDQIDLRSMIRESVLLDVPEAPLCRPDCPGLCPVCGADMSTETCSCVVETVDPRWSVLSDLRDSLPE
ncbi:MAG: YceD family protein [Ilumatobacteraceae bacterium]